MSAGEKLGLGALVLVFILFAALLFFTFRPPLGGGSGVAEDSLFVQQRVKNVNKGQ